ncbi:MAG TPA: DUF4266 domain-containing protein [Opitutaceae bacterium]|nr:DUF4266 domain-containing protein [Opitutaceae bacterium]
MRIFTRTLLLKLSAAALLAALASGCSTVKVQPWERGTFTEYSMRPDRDPLASAMGEHTFFSREATGGGRSVGGSACGCN